MDRDGDIENFEISAFNEIWQKNLKQSRKYQDAQRIVNTEKMFRADRITIRQSDDLDDLLSQAEIFIRWCYENDWKTRGIRGIPKEDRQNWDMLDSSTIAGILWKIGTPRRPKVMPEPFILVFGKWIVYDDAGKRSAMLIMQGRRVITAPELSADYVIRWVNIRRGVSDYYVRHPIDEMPQFNISQCRGPDYFV